jgi:uncharacterized YccA/Bax inhibitor family protein
MYQLVLLVITLAFTLPLVGSMYYAALALVDSFKRDTTPFLAPAFATCHGTSFDDQHAYVPFGVWQVARLASIPHHPASVTDSGGVHAASV